MKVREKRGGLSHNQLYTRFNCSSDQILKNGVRNVNVKEQFRKDHYQKNNHSLTKTPVKQFKHISLFNSVWAFVLSTIKWTFCPRTD